MDKKYSTGMFQVIPTILAVVLAAPCGGAILRSLEMRITELPLMIAGALSGALIGIASWLLMVLFDQATSRRK